MIFVSKQTVSLQVDFQSISEAKGMEGMISGTSKGSQS